MPSTMAPFFVEENGVRRSCMLLVKKKFQDNTVLTKKTVCASDLFIQLMYRIKFWGYFCFCFFLNCLFGLICFLMYFFQFGGTLNDFRFPCNMVVWLRH